MLSHNLRTVARTASGVFPSGDYNTLMFSVVIYTFEDIFFLYDQQKSNFT